MASSPSASRAGAQRRSGPDRLRAGHHHLGVVAVHSVGVRCHHRSTEVDDGDVEVAAVSTHYREMVGVELAVSDADVVQVDRRRPDLLDDRPVVDAVAEICPRCADRTQDKECVVAGSHARGHDVLGHHARLRREQRDEALVRDLLAASDPERRTGLAVPHRVPERGEELGVMRIASVHLHEQRAVGVLALHQEETGLLTVGRPERPCVDPELRERGRDLGKAGVSLAGAEDQVHDRRPDRRDEDGGKCAARRGRLEEGSRHGCQTDEPDAESPRWSAEMRARGQQHRAEHGQTQRREPRRGFDRPERAPVREPIALHESADHEREGERHDRGEEQIADQGGPSPHGGDDDDQDRSHDEDVGERLPDGIKEVGKASNERDERPLDRGRWNREDAQDRKEERRRDELDDVARSARARLVDRSREEAEPAEGPRADPQPTHARTVPGASWSLRELS